MIAELMSDGKRRMEGALDALKVARPLLVTGRSDRFLDRLKDVYERWTLPMAVDILVYTPTEWTQMIEEERGFILRILREGREIYARPKG